MNNLQLVFSFLDIHFYAGVSRRLYKYLWSEQVTKLHILVYYFCLNPSKSLLSVELTASPAFCDSHPPKDIAELTIHYSKIVIMSEMLR